jgi:oxygen-independent coproporphyrinogen-3 oxidase
MPLPLCPASATVVPAQLPPVVARAVYVHIPFCFHKCHYCDFYSITRQGDDRMSRFVDLALSEAALWGEGEPGPTPIPQTVFFGGGTPTLLPPELMRRLIEGLRRRIDFTTVEEWTVECNPATVREAYGAEYLALLRSLGVNRLSFGAQSFHQPDLAVLERHHNPDDVPASLDLARKAGFERLNIDLIYAIPGQSLTSWQQTLETAIALETEHISCYGLTYEPNTPMGVKHRLGAVRSAEEEIELAMFHHTRQRLTESGRPAYEVSNYARPGCACRHNLAYWNGDDYLSIGPSAASHVQGRRWKNRPHLGEWERAVESGRLPAADFEVLSPQQRAGELAMSRLRLADGIEYADFADRTGYDARHLFARPFAELSSLGLLDVLSDRARLTERGWDVADAVAGKLIDVV